MLVIEESIDAMTEHVKEGKIRYLGLSKASVEPVCRAYKVHPMAALQSKYSLLSRDIEKQILPTLYELNIPLVPHSSLVQGMFTEDFDISHMEPMDLPLMLLRFQVEHLKNN